MSYSVMQSWNSFCLKIYKGVPDPITFGYIHRNGVFGIRRKALYIGPICHHPCKILRPRDVDFNVNVDVEKIRGFPLISKYLFQ